MGNVCSFQFGCEALLSRCADWFAKRSAYIKELENNLAALRTEFEELIAVRNDVMTSVTIAEQQRMERTDQVKVWLSNVQAVEAKVAPVQGVGSQEIEKLCFGGYCSKNFKSSYQFGKRVAKTLQEVKDLKGKGDLREVAKAIPEDPADELPMDPKIVGQQLIVNKVWSCLKQNDIGTVGLHGMGGVGKTTLLKQINSRFLRHEGHHFDVVIWSVVSKDHKNMKIQDSIGKKIGLCEESWNTKSQEEKARDIFKILSKKKFVLLLDDIWDRVDLIELGVPPPNTKMESKVVFTTRSFAVCRQMEADREFEVNCLQPKEAWKLFQNKVGRDILNSHSEIPKLAEIVVKKCRGLPLALNTVGRAMACKKTLEEWKDAVEVLRTSAFEFPGMEKEVYSLLKFSYDSLPNENIRSCFLYCTLFPEDHLIDKRHVIECWLAEGLLGEYDRKGTDRGYSILGDLIRACLLEDENDSVRMHDIVRDMALWITCEIEKEKENVLMEAGVGLSEAPEIKKWEGVKRISLMVNKIENLSGSPNCPNLLTLFLAWNRLSIIANDFFQFMPSLKVLSLYNNDFLRELPAGISNLVSLQHLDLSFSGLVMLPEEIKALVNLKHLDVQSTHHLRRFPRKILPNLLMLRTLLFEDSGIYAIAAEDSILFNDGESLIEELPCLEHLNFFSISARSARALKKFSSSHKFQNCCHDLCLRDIEDKFLNVSSFAGMKHLRTLNIHSRDFQALEIDSAALPQFPAFHLLHRVHVSSCHELKDITWVILAPNLKIIKMSNCDRMEEIISVEKLTEIQEKLRNPTPLSVLESLELLDIPQLKSIYSKPLPSLYLKKIVAYRCPMLKKVPFKRTPAEERKYVIEGDACWLEELQWEDDFGSCFEIHEDDKNDRHDNEHQGTSE